ncbi:alpha/beta hydrolase [Steroidobacter sp.]|uniref:alpha/beta hydrolase n=1 Tax=Steroidobacter sp. TaxID=1978227 RepID=UPI001A54CE8F|nr:alpha/beta hydrolase [Steroidobacter sp.]MBL8267999.1 alpha/beta hydrolase [Steroidobacter sp.]
MRHNLFVPVLVAILLSACSSQPADPPDLQLTTQERETLAAARQPESWFVSHLKGPREKVDGDLLNPKMQYVLETFSRPSSTPEAEQEERAAFATEEGRRAARASVDRRWTINAKLTADMASVEDRRIPGRDAEIPVRIYRPKSAGEGTLPVLVYFHGGGYIFGSIAAVDRQVRLIANEAEVIVVSVDYRLAPEHPYPAPQNDAEDAYLWVRDNAASFGGDVARIGVGGDSAGGQLATVISYRQLQAKRPLPLYQLLYYPAVHTRQNDRSYELFGVGYGLDRSFVDLVVAMAFPDPAVRDGDDAIPFNATSLAGMPATILAAAGYDPLRSSGRALARKLEKDGVSVIYLNFSSLTHSFLNWSGVIDDADKAATLTARLFGQAIRSRAAQLAETEGGS